MLHWVVPSALNTNYEPEGLVHIGTEGAGKNEKGQYFDDRCEAHSPVPEAVLS